MTRSITVDFIWMIEIFGKSHQRRGNEFIFMIESLQNRSDKGKLTASSNHGQECHFSRLLKAWQRTVPRWSFIPPQLSAVVQTGCILILQELAISWNRFWIPLSLMAPHFHPHANRNQILIQVVVAREVLANFVKKLTIWGNWMFLSERDSKVSMGFEKPLVFV